MGSVGSSENDQPAQSGATPCAGGHEPSSGPATAAEAAATFAELHDRVIRDVQECALSLTSLLGSRLASSDPTAETLQCALETLDRLIRDIRTTAFSVREQLRSSDAHPSRTSTRFLIRVEDEVVIAYMDGHDFRRVHDDSLWGHDSDGLLLSARSGSTLARRNGHIYYDTVTSLPLYYETR